MNFAELGKEYGHIDTLVGILTEMYKLESYGKLGGSDTAQWISDDIEYVGMFFLGWPANSDYQFRLQEKHGKGHSITYEEALYILKARITNSVLQIIY